MTKYDILKADYTILLARIKTAPTQRTECRYTLYPDMTSRTSGGADTYLQ